MTVNATIANAVTGTNVDGRRTEINGHRSGSQSGWMSQLRRRAMAIPKLT